MEDLEVNPLYRAFLTKFRREFEIACKMCYLTVIPHSDSLDDINIDQFLANSHILVPSKLLKMHYTPLQIGYSDDIEIDGRRLIVHVSKGTKFIVNILAEELGYNVNNKEYRTLLIDRPLMAANQRGALLIGSFLSPRLSTRRPRTTKPPKPLAGHDDCSKYLEYLSQDLTTQLETDVKRLQSNYMILARYLDDAANRLRELAEVYVTRYESFVQQRDNTICDTVRRAIRLSVENYVVHLLHGKLMASIHNKHSCDDQKLLERLNVIKKSGLSICQLGAQSAFVDFNMNEELVQGLRQLPSLQSPLAIVSCLIRLVDLISEGLSEGLRFKHMIGDSGCLEDQEPVSICSDDLIASFVFSLAQAKPFHLYSTSKYLDMFGWSSSAKDQAAYYTATFQIAIQYVFSYTANDEHAESLCESSHTEQPE